MKFDEEKLKQIKDLCINWPNLGKLSKEAVYIFHMIGTEDKMVLYSNANCYLASRNTEEKEDIDKKYVDELRNHGLIAPLSQFGYGSKMGWREMGNIGEKFDIYLCVQ